MTSLGPSFYQKLVKMTSEIGMNPEDLLNIMAIESGLNPASHNANGDASGLVQFMPSSLKAMGYKGTHTDFRKLSGEEQLDYIKGFLKNMITFNGGPFKSAAQYYTGNFLPVALKLPGVKNEDPNTIIVAKNPDKPHLPNVSTKLESIWYKANPGLDFNKDGVITYGDIQNVVDRSSKSKLYLNALSMLKNTTGYKPKDKSNTKVTDIDALLDEYLKEVSANRFENKLYKLLPNNNYLIKINSNNYSNSVEFGRILCTAIEEKLDGKAYRYTNNKNIEVECSIKGPKQDCFNCLKELTSSLSEIFQEATTKIGSVNVNSEVIMDKKSKYPIIDYKKALIEYRKFIIKFNKES